MNIARTLAAIGITAIGVIAPATQAAATPNCDGTAAFNHIGYTLNDSPEVGKLSDLTGLIQPGDTLTITSTIRPECADTPHSIVLYGVAEPRFDEAEVQTVITAFTAPSNARIVIPQSDKPGQCRVQIDDITGPIHSVIDRTHRYNEQAIGGTRNRLVLTAAYTTSDQCGDGNTETIPHLPPTSAPVQVTTTVPPTVDVPLTEAPTTTAPAPTPPAGPVPSTPTAVVGGDPTPLLRTTSLPVTGAETRRIAGVGALAIIVGLLLAGLAPTRRRCTAALNNTTNSQENNPR